jgi:PAT family beta-lactamase induction signal transducer AmpG
MRAWLRDHGTDIAVIGVTSLLALPYSLKFLWAPLVDRIGAGGARRRRWLAGTQAALALLVGLLGWLDPVAGAAAVGTVCLLIAVAGATQDLAADAYRTEVCGPAERAPGASAFVLGYRVGMLLAVWGGLALAGDLGWRTVFLGLAGLLAVQALISRWRPEPPPAPPATLAELVVLPAQVLWARFAWATAAVLLFSAAVRAADALAGTLAVTFLQERYGTADTGFLRGGVGLAATVAGTALAGVLGAWLGTGRLLVLATILGGASNLAYAWLAAAGGGLWAGGAAVAVEQACGGLLGTALVAWFMGLCDPRCAAGQYALLTAASSLPGILLGSLTGVWQKELGWTGFFALTAAIAVPAIILLPLVLRDRPCAAPSSSSSPPP